MQIAAFILMLVAVAVGVSIATQRGLHVFKQLAAENGLTYRWLPVEGFEVGGSNFGIGWSVHHGRKENVGFEAQFQSSFRSGVAFAVVDAVVYGWMSAAFRQVAGMLVQAAPSQNTVAGLVLGPKVVPAQGPAAKLGGKFVILGDAVMCALLTEEVVQGILAQPAPVALFIYDGMLRIDVSPISRGQLAGSIKDHVGLGKALLANQRLI